jgi:hypothetical protein
MTRPLRHLIGQTQANVDLIARVIAIKRVLDKGLGDTRFRGVK